MRSTSEKPNRRGCDCSGPASSAPALPTLWLKIVLTKWGNKNGGRQGFRCKEASCGKTFSASTGSPLSGLHYPELHKKNAECMIDGLSIRKAAARLGINKSTAFRWRHRFLDSMQDRQPAKLGCVVEADETFFLESYSQESAPSSRSEGKETWNAGKTEGLSSEQIPVLVARDRSTGATLSVVLCNRAAEDIGEVLLPRLSAVPNYSQMALAPIALSLESMRSP